MNDDSFEFMDWDYPDDESSGYDIRINIPKDYDHNDAEQIGLVLADIANVLDRKGFPV